MANPDTLPDISILLVSWNTLALTRTCIGTIAQSVSAHTTFESIVVDNGSTDGSSEALATDPTIELIVNKDNVGFARAVNQAYARSHGRSILLLNSDIELDPGSVDVLLRFLVDHPGVAGVGPRYLNPDTTPQQHHFRLPSFSMLLAGQSAILRRLPGLSSSSERYRMLDVDLSYAQPVEQPSASVLLLRRDVLPVGYLLDENFPIFFNDVELALRLREAGHYLWMTPDAVVVHAHGASTRLLGGSLVRHHLASQVRYLRLTQPRWRFALFGLVVFVQKSVARLLRRPGALPFRELTAALRGDPGPLPQVPRT